MTMLLQNRTISMILTVPNVKELTSPLSHSVEDLHQKSLVSSKNRKPPCIPIYHGSIIRIEQHREHENISDLIVRVPNFHHSSLSSVIISPNYDQLSESQRETSFKRRAPICPILNDAHTHAPASSENQTNELDSSNVNPSETNTRLTNTQRFAIRLRHLSQALATNYRSKRTTNINDITIIPTLPDVEIIPEGFELPSSTKKTSKHPNRTSKFIPPKILSIKRKCFQTKRKQPSSNVLESQTDSEDNTFESSRTDINVKDNDAESKRTTPIQVNYETEQVTPKVPTILIDPESSSTHRYSTIPLVPRTTMSDRDAEDMSSARSQSEQTQHSDDQIDDTLYVVHPNGDTYSECYEVTYQYDPDFQHFLGHKNEQLYLPEIEDRSSIRFNLDSFEYQGLPSTLTTWLPVSSTNYEAENVNQTRLVSERQPMSREATIPRVRFRSLEDFSQINGDQPTIHPSASASVVTSSYDHDQLLSLDEDYTVIIQLLKHVLQLDRTPDDDDNEFHQYLSTN